MSLRLVMLGTGSFALSTFQGLYETSHTVVGLVTQPDRTGRGHHHHVNPMKELAIKHGTPVFQPVKANEPESLERLREFDADLFVTAAYGQILSADLLSIPRLGAINIHASLLPKYRGAAPIQFAIINGETETGITIFRIEPKLDAGPVLGVLKTAIGDNESYGDLQDRLATLAVPLTCQIIDDLAAGTATETIQDGTLVTKAPRLTKTDGVIPWQKSSRLVGCHIRGVQPWPKPSTILHVGDNAIRMLVLDVETSDRLVSGDPGTVEVVDRKRIFVRTQDGSVELLTVQPEGKRPMSPVEFLNGHTITSGNRFELPDQAD
ncbi:MAG: methionyl-tRNA formyltransferase [Planctomycetota bacterium]|nr:methionyl-tRNA formyltransferase [Planctomycetota bacterium]MDA1162816.1 methionyl-tRNA formyltransferase [Planctomycetota bacterium]